MRVAFAGTPEFARSSLAAIAAAGNTVPLVLTQPDRPAGRGLRLLPSPVKAWAEAHGSPVAQPRGLRLDGRWADDAAAARDALAQAAPDVLVVAAYGLILPQWVLDLPRLGCLNIHASILPRWRGAAPVQRAIEAGDAETGVTIMQMDAGLDTGPTITAQAIPIGPDETAATLTQRLAGLGAGLIVEVLAAAAAAPPAAAPQPGDGVTYAAKIDKAEAPIDWSQPAAVIERRLRAFDPFPGATVVLDGEVVKCWRAEIAAAAGAPGEVLGVDAQGIVVACGAGSVRLTELQCAGGKRLPAAQFLQRSAPAVGSRLATASGI